MENQSRLEIALSKQSLHEYLEEIQQARSNIKRLKAILDSISDDFTLTEQHQENLQTILADRIDGVFEKMLKKAKK